MRNTIGILTVAVGFLITSVAQAEIMGTIDLVERAATDYGVSNWNEYVIGNHSGAAVEVFAVSNNQQKGVATTRSGWLATAISKESWDSTRYPNLNGGKGAGYLKDCTIVTPYTAGCSGVLWLKSLGSFESLFGPTDTWANLYWKAATSGMAINDGETATGFYFGAHWLSEIAAFDSSGTLIYQSYREPTPNSVPEPSVVTLLGLALVGLAWFRANRLPS